MIKFKTLLLSILVIVPMLSFSQDNNLTGKWKFNVELVQYECSNWISDKTKEIDTLGGNKLKALKKELNMVKQIEGSINFSFRGLVYNFLSDTTLNIISTQGNVSTEIAYEVKENQLILKYPQLPNPAIYRMEFKNQKLYIYELVNGIERFAQVLERF